MHETQQIEQTQRLNAALRSHEFALVRDTGLTVSASLLMAVAAHVSVPLFFSPVPVTLQPLAMLVIAFFLGGKRAFAAMVLYLLEGVIGLPVFSPAGPGGAAQLAGPTGGFLMATPLAAYLAGELSRSGVVPAVRSLTLRLVLAAGIAEAVLFTGGISWFAVSTHATLGQAISLALLPFVPGEVLKVSIAVGAASLWRRKFAK